MSTDRQPKVKLPLDAHTRLRIWAAIHQTTIQSAIVRAIDLLVQGCPAASTSTPQMSSKA
jgi:hypothetical protein